MQDIREAIRQVFRESSFPQYADAFSSLLRPSIQIQTHTSKALSRSHFGGIPEVPPEFEWPTWDMTVYLQWLIGQYANSSELLVDNREVLIAQLESRISNAAIAPLNYLGQIHLTEAPHSEYLSSLPKTGVLYFFYDLENAPLSDCAHAKQGWRCIYIDTPDNQLQPLSHQAHDDYLFHRCSLSFQFAWMYSCPGYRFKEFDQYNVSKKEHQEIIEQLWEEHGIIVPTVGSNVEHYLFGYPGPMQEPNMERICQFGFQGIDSGETETGETERGMQDWRLLLQLDSDNSVGFEFGDTGRLYFWIREQDLREHSFSQVWCDFQCA